MEKRKVISLVLVLAMSTGLMTGCGNSTQTDVVEDTQSVVETITPSVVDKDTNRVDAYEKMPEVKVFEPGEHVFMIRYNLVDELGYSSAKGVNSTSISVPEGYEILDLENFISLGSKIGTCETYGVDVWFINNESVEVTPVYNESFDSYDYSQPGKVIEPVVSNENELGK